MKDIDLEEYKTFYSQGNQVIEYISYNIKETLNIYDKNLKLVSSFI